MCPGQFYIRGRTKLRGHRDFRRWNSRHPGRSRFNRPRRGLDRWVSLTKRLLFNVTALPGYEIPRTIRFVHRNSTRFWFKCSVHSGGFCEVRVDLCHRHCISINFHAVRAYVRIPIWPVILLRVDVKRASSPLEEKSQLTFTHSGLRGRTINRLLVSLYTRSYFFRHNYAEV